MGERLARRGRPSPATLTVAVTVLVTAGYLLHLSRTLWFFGDDWDFLLHRSLSGHAERGLLEPHNEHWTTLPIIAFRILFAVFGLRHYLPYAALPVLAHCLSVIVMYALLRRLGTRSWPAALAVVPMALLGAGAENLLWDFQVGFIGAVPLALLAMLVLERGHGPAALGGSWILLVAGLMCAGTAIALVLWTVLFVLVRSGLLRAVLVGSVPALVYLAWYLIFGRSAAATPSPQWDLVIPAMLHGIGSVWEQMLPLPGAGTVVIAALLLVSLLAVGDQRLGSLALSGLGAMVAYYGLVTLSRVGIGGVDAATASRYSYIGFVLTVPALALSVQVVSDRMVVARLVRVTVATVFALAMAGLGASGLAQFHQSRVGTVGDSRGALVAAEQLIHSRAVLLSGRPQPTYAPDIDVRSLERASVLDALPHVRLTSRDRLEASGGLQVGLSRTSLPVVRADAGRVRGLPEPFNPDGCSSGRLGAPTVVSFPLGRLGGQVQVRSQATSLATYLTRGALESSPVIRQIEPGSPTWVGSSARRVTLHVQLAVGEYLVCAGQRVAAPSR